MGSVCSASANVTRLPTLRLCRCWMLHALACDAFQGLPFGISVTPLTTLPRAPFGVAAAFQRDDTSPLLAGA